MVVVVMLISDLLYVLHFQHLYILKKVETFLLYFKQLPAKIDNQIDFKNNKLQILCYTGCFTKMYSETCRINVWESKYLSSNIQIFLENLMHLPKKELQLKDKFPSDNYKISDKYLKVQFLKT